MSPRCCWCPCQATREGTDGGAAGDGWLLHCGDAVALGGELGSERPTETLGGRLANWWVGTDRQARLWNRDRLRALIRDHGDEVQVFCSHDPGHLAQFE